MANTTYLKTVVEPHIVRWLSRHIGVQFSPKRLRVGFRADGTPAHFAFDGVSEDGRTAALVSTSFTLKSGGERKLFVDAAVLLRTRLKRRLMAFVSRDVRDNFVNRCDGLLDLRKIEMIIAPGLPKEMRRRIGEIQTEAKGEVGDKGRKLAPRGRRR